MSDKDETGKSSVQDNEESHTEGSHDIVSLSSVVDQIRVRALANYRPIAKVETDMDEDKNPGPGSGHEGPHDRLESETRDLGDRVANTLSEGKRVSEGIAVNYCPNICKHAEKHLDKLHDTCCP